MMEARAKGSSGFDLLFNDNEGFQVLAVPVEFTLMTAFRDKEGEGITALVANSRLNVQLKTMSRSHFGTFHGGTVPYELGQPVPN